MTKFEMIADVQRLWASGPVRVFKVRDCFATALAGTPECAEIEYMKCAQLIGTYERPHKDADANTYILEDLNA